eukprot:TRINITY_DN39987_c0_g1_i1.p1 TRINITY_DN39987_c0_g1~~TRINITY_DN39987_c0_g1_i1.p1  ORF type:complete len:438 (+),score=108.60 TRINITY_DN39987_c0_g1_i1:124-1437(+)
MNWVLPFTVALQLTALQLCEASGWTTEMVSTCGGKNFDFSPENPCMFRVFSFSLAWAECKANAGTGSDKEDFGTCITNCVASDQCIPLCESIGRPLAECKNLCTNFVSCVHEAGASGPEAESTAASCLSGLRPTGSAAAGAPAAPGPALVQEVAAPLPSSAAFLAQQGQPVALFSPWAVVGEFFGASSPLTSSTKAALIRHHQASKATLGSHSKQAGLALEPEKSGACRCSASGILAGVDTKAKGCKAHGKESKAGKVKYCFVEGANLCSEAQESEKFKGAFWMKCAQPDADYQMMFPAGCKLASPAGAQKAGIDVPMQKTLEEGVEQFKNVDVAAATHPAPESQMLKTAKETAAEIVSWSTSLMPDWHLENPGFQEGAAESMEALSEQHLPPALQGAGTLTTTPAAPVLLAESELMVARGDPNFMRQAQAAMATGF